MATINDRNRIEFGIAKRRGEEVAFSYCAKSDGHERIVVGTVEELTENHVALNDKVRGGSYRLFILDRIRGSILRLSEE